AKLRHRASVEDIDFRTPRGLDRTLVRSLIQDSGWVREHLNLFLIGPTGIGKSFLGCALAEKACRDGFTALYTRAKPLFRDLALARSDGSLRTQLARLARFDVLMVDDWAMAPLSDAERRDFLEICEDRYQRRSTVLTSQLPVAKWHEQIGDPTLADSILDRLVHNAHRIEMAANRCGKSAAVRRSNPQDQGSEGGPPDSRESALNGSRSGPASLRSEKAERKSAVEMTPRGKRGKLKKRVSHSFPPGLEIRQNAPDFHISTAPAARLIP